MTRGVVDSTANPKPQQPGRYYALVIGINGYRDFNRLQTPRNDATEIARELQDHYGFVTTLLLDATRDQILGALDGYRGSLHEEDNLLVYYAGHGWDDKQAGEAYWIPVDGQKDTTARWINAAEITGKARAIAARHVLIISDSCYSGMLTEQRDIAPTIGDPRERGRALQKALEGKSRQIMSSGGDEPVSDVNAPGHSSSHSVFADALLQGFREIAANEFSARELFNQYVYDQVGGESQQVPEYTPIRDSGHNSGDFIFFRLPAALPTRTTAGSGAASRPALPASATSPPGGGDPAVQPAALLAQAKALLQTGSGDPQGTALPLFKRAAEAGNAEAMRYVGVYYDSSFPADKGVPKDNATAAAWYRKAAEAGNALAMNELGFMYEQGRGVPQDDVQAVSWYRKAAEAGNALGMYNLGVAYERGRVVAQDDAQAVNWYRKAAEAGNLLGMNNLGVMYEKGRGVTQDDAQAVNWYRKAAEAGNALGMNNLGVMYEKGHGVTQDDAKAVSWYRKAAEAGNPLGMRNLGLRYENGRGVPKDQAQALDLYRKAAAAGDEWAQNRLKELGDR